MSIKKYLEGNMQFYILRSIYIYIYKETLPRKSMLTTTKIK